MRILHQKIFFLFLIFTGVYGFSDETTDTQNIKNFNGQIINKPFENEINLIAGNIKILGNIKTRGNKFIINLTIADDFYTGIITQNAYGVFKKWFDYNIKFNKNNNYTIQGGISQQYKKFSSINYLADFNLESNAINIKGSIQSKGKLHKYNLIYNNNKLKGVYNLEQNYFNLEIVNDTNIKNFFRGKIDFKIRKDVFSLQIKEIKSNDIFIFLLIYFYEKIEINSKEKYETEPSFAY